MKKILHLTQTDIRSDSRILKEMMSAYNDSYDVYGIGVKLTEKESKQDLDNYNVITLNMFSNRLKLLPKPIKHTFTLCEFFIKSIFHSIKIKPDIVHCNDTLVLPVGVIIKLLTKSKLIYDAHELESDRNGLSKLLGKATLLTEKKLWSFVDGFIVVSPSIKEWYMKNIGYKNSIIVLNSPVFKKIEKENSDYLRSKFSIPNGNKIFIYIGILGYGRGIDIILEAFVNQKNAHLVFLGDGDYYKRVKSFESNYHNIHVHDSVEHSKVVEVARSADVGLCLIENVSLSDYYCLPNKLFEYAFADLLILASNFPDIKKVINDFSLGVCVDLEIESIRNGINILINSDFSHLQNNKNLFELSWESQELKLLSLYSSVLNN